MTPNALSVSILLGKKSITPLSLRLNRSLDSMADQAIFEFPWTPGQDTSIDQLAHLFSYTGCSISIGDVLCLTGKAYNITNRLSSAGSVKTIEAYSDTVDLVDSCMPTSVRGQYGISKSGESVGVYTDSIAKDIASFFQHADGSALTASFPAGKRGQWYPTLDYSPTEKCGKIISRIAFQSALIASNDVKGNLQFFDANAFQNQTPVGTLQEGDGLPNEFDIKADGRARFGIYVGIGSSGDPDTISSSIIDPVVPRMRRDVFIVEDAPMAGVVSASQWRKNQQLILALSLSIPVSSWYAPNGQLWAPGMMVTVKSATMEIPDGFTFVIRESEHTLDDGGYKCTLKICPPQAYTTQPLKEPWAGTGKWTVTT